MFLAVSEAFGPITQQLIQDTSHRAWGIILIAGGFGLLGLVTMAAMLFVRIRTPADPMDHEACVFRSRQVIGLTLSLTVMIVVVCGILGTWIGDIVAPTLSVFTQFGKVISTQ
jgi:hypothetical protein